MNKRIEPHEIRMAYHRIKGDIRTTPLEFSPVLSRISGARVFLKMEQQQLTGSFKIRGVCNKIKSLNGDDFQRPFFAASTGNHAAAFAYSSQKFGFTGTLFLPQNTSEVKKRALRAFDVNLLIQGKNSMEAEAIATEHANSFNGVLIHPYNDVPIIEGQGTIGVEIEEQLPEVDTIVAPIGGGGLVAGLCSFFDSDRVRVIGCQPANAAEMIESLQCGYIVEPSTKNTISDATAGGIEADSLTFAICKNQLDDYELIEEEAIKKAIAFMVEEHQIIIEPSAALSVAALLNSENYRGKNVVLVLTGKKINPQLLMKILKEYGNYYA